MWKRVVGNEVLNSTEHAISSPGENSTLLRAYTHRGAPPSPYAVPFDVGTDVTVILINLDEEEAAVDIAGAVKLRSWALSPGPPGPSSGQLLLKGIAWPAAFSDGKPIDSIPVAGIEDAGPRLTAPPFSVTFVVASF
jgi:hypothetical protein